MKLDKKQIMNFLPHRDPFLFLDSIEEITYPDSLKDMTLKSLKQIIGGKVVGHFHVTPELKVLAGHFPGNPVMPGVLIVEAFGQAAAALTAAGIDKKEYENKLVFLMGIEKARFRNPVIPDCRLELNIEATRSHGRVWKYKGEAFVEGKKMADATWSATVVDRK